MFIYVYTYIYIYVDIYMYTYVHYCHIFRLIYLAIFIKALRNRCIHFDPET